MNFFIVIETTTYYVNSINLLNLRSGLWDNDNPVKNKLKKIIKLNS